jgi:uncharacterized protein (TIGR00251 family)
VARLLVKVYPRAKSNCLSGKSGEAYRLHLKAPPVDGKANEACIRFFASLFGLPRASVLIVSGLTSRMKVLRIDGVTQAEMESRMPQ